MPKSASPIRLQDDLMKEAATTGAIMNRSTAEQIEYWASIGKSLSATIDPNTLIDVVSGLATLEVKETENVNVEFDDILSELEDDRQSDVLKDKVANPDSVRYQASRSQPGFLEEIHPDGTVLVGKFVMGEFRAQ